MSSREFYVILSRDEVCREYIDPQDKGSLDAVPP